MQRLLCGFICFKLSTGEFPLSSLVGIWFSERQEDLSLIVDDDRSCNPDRFINQLSLPWHCLNFFPEPQGQGSFLPTFRPSRT